MVQDSAIVTMADQ